MVTTIVIVAALFAIFGFVRQSSSCGGNCGMCHKACSNSEHHHE